MNAQASLEGSSTHGSSSNEEGAMVKYVKPEIDNFVGRAIPVLLLVYPILLLSVRDGTATCYVLLLVLSILYLFRLGWRNIDRSYSDIAFAFSMACLVGATLISQLYHRSFRLESLDSP